MKSSSDNPRKHTDTSDPAQVINTVRFLAVDAIQKANSGHPGMPMGAAPMAYVIWENFLRHNPQDPGWPDRDRFVLSAGHGSMLLYALLHLTGYDVSLDDIKDFRQWGSKTPGHPEYGETPGVETTTGPLGQGVGNAVGMALAERYLATVYNKPGFNIVNHYTYAIAGDGCLMEGVSQEAASLAGHLGLGRLILLYDDNHITIDGPTSLAFTEDVAERFIAYGWHVQRVGDGNDIDALGQAVQEARDATDCPSLIAVRTHIAYGSPNKQDSSSAHGSPLGEEEIKLTKENLGWPTEPAFHVPEQAAAFRETSIERGSMTQAVWQELFAEYKGKFPDLAASFERALAGDLPDGWERLLPGFDKAIASRAASGAVINAVAEAIPALIGGSADLAPSNNTVIKASTDCAYDNHAGRNLRFGVREHGMGSILNGLALHGGIIPYGGTFLVFADYMRPAIRLAALMGLRVIYVFTHDSIGLGEDGPTHQPVEHLAALRCIPNLTVIRPADAFETAGAWHYALTHRDGPTALVLSRQGLPLLDIDTPQAVAAVAAGAHVVYRTADATPDAILIATGSEVSLAIDAAGLLAAEGRSLRVLSMPSWEIFEAQSDEKKQEMLPDGVPVISVEAQVTQGWERWTGSRDRCIGVDRFGASAPGKVLFEKYGLTPDAVAARVRKILD